MHTVICVIDLDRKPVYADDDYTVLNDEERNLLEQEVYLLRLRLLHFVNGLHEYIMTMVS